MTTEVLNPKRRPSLRLTKDFEFFDQDGSHLWRTYRASTVVADPKEMEWLTKIGAPVELISIDSQRGAINRVE